MKEQKEIVNSKSILLIEDNAKDAELILVALENCNQKHNVFLVEDGLEAINYLFYQGDFLQSTHKLPVLILLDLKIPKINGFKVLEKIKKDPKLKNIPVVVLTSSSNSEDVSRCYKLGANAFVIKPTSFKEFQKIIEMICFFWIEIYALSMNRSS